MAHTKCREEKYQYRSDNNHFGTVNRFSVPDDKVDWSVNFPSYSPTEFTAPFVLSAVWADPDIGTDGFNPQWNSLDGKVNRVSHVGIYQIKDNKPLNVIGRTGLSGRGVLGKWGPNHAADPIVTRWKRDGEGQVVVNEKTGMPVLQFVSIQRRDSGEWAIPGGMVDPGELVTTTVKREFMEEALDTTDTARDQAVELAEMVEQFFKIGQEVYRGYVDDPRNTDSAWMETVAFNFHDETGEKVGSLPLHAGDDAKDIRWCDLDGQMPLYASHSKFLKIVAENKKAHW